MSQKNKELKPCPFCGSAAFMWGFGHKYRISCEKDCVSMPSRPDVWFSNDEQAAKAWNKRVNENS